MSDELDRRTDPTDEDYNVSGSNGPDIAYLILQGYFARQEQTLPTDPNANFLGLGAGLADAETGFAKLVGVSDSQITLVDNTPQTDIREAVLNSHPKVKYESAGIFEYLQKSSIQYSWITAFGLEDKLQGKKMVEFIKRVVPVVKPSGFVICYPYRGSDVNNIWQSNGFSPIHNSTMQLYRKM